MILNLAKSLEKQGKVRLLPLRPFKKLFQLGRRESGD